MNKCLLNRNKTNSIAFSEQIYLLSRRSSTYFALKVYLLWQINSTSFFTTFAKNSKTNCTSVEFMAEELTIATGNKAERYATLLPQMAALLEGETDQIAGMANLSAALSQTFGFFWTGFYRVMEDQLVLGPFQGPIACTRIAFGKGVCGTAWERAETVIVPDVDAFPGHIACNSASRSEIVVPVKADGKVIAVLDIDSDQLNMFDEVDQHFLEQMVALLTAHRAL